MRAGHMVLGSDALRREILESCQDGRDALLKDSPLRHVLVSPGTNRLPKGLRLLAILPT